MKAVENFKKHFIEAVNDPKSLNDNNENDKVNKQTKSLLDRTALQFFNFIPIEGEVSGFFATVIREIHQLMKSSECMPCQPIRHSNKRNFKQKEPQEDIEWLKPCDVLIAPKDERLANLVNSGLLFKHLGLKFLHSKVILHHGVRQSLGVSTFSSTHLIKLLDVACQGKSNKDVNNIEHWKWIANCLAYLSTVREGDLSKAQDNLKLLHTVSILPMINGTITNPSAGMVFFPPGGEREQSENVDKNTKNSNPLKKV